MDSVDLFSFALSLFLSAGCWWSPRAERKQGWKGNFRACSSDRVRTDTSRERRRLMHRSRVINVSFLRLNMETSILQDAFLTFSLWSLKSFILRKCSGKIRSGLGNSRNSSCHGDPSLRICQKMGIMCKKEVCNAQNLHLFPSQGEDGFPGFKGDMGVKGDRVRDLFVGWRGCLCLALSRENYGIWFLFSLGSIFNSQSISEEAHKSHRVYI